MSNIAVIDTETTWGDDVMSIGAVVADGRDFSIVDSRYYLIDPYFEHSAMYSSVLHMRGTPEEIVVSRYELGDHMMIWLDSHGVDSIFAYNALFDKNHMREFSHYRWYDIMRMAAYRQFNPCIPADAPCCKTGRLKTGYGVEPMYRLLSGNCRYFEKHNGWYDAVDELKIMELLGLPLEAYEQARI